MQNGPQLPGACVEVTMAIDMISSVTSIAQIIQKALLYSNLKCIVELVGKLTPQFCQETLPACFLGSRHHFQSRHGDSLAIVSTHA